MTEVVIVDIDKCNANDVFPSLIHAINASLFIALDAVSISYPNY